MPQEFDAVLSLIGAFCFGVVIGWVTYRTLRRNQANTGLTDIATVIGAVGGAAVTGIWKPGTGAFGSYCIGLIVGFFGYLAIAAKNKGQPEWMGSEDPRADLPRQQSNARSDLASTAGGRIGT